MATTLFCCGVVVLFALVAIGQVAQSESLPNGYAWGCLNISKQYPFCDATLPVEDRVEDLLNRLTMDESIGLMGPSPYTHVDECNCMDIGVQRLGIPAYMHLVETNTAVASACLGPFKCATNYASPALLAASFNRSLWLAKGDAISEEMRAFNNLNWLVKWRWWCVWGGCRFCRSFSIVCVCRVCVCVCRHRGTSDAPYSLIGLTGFGPK